MQVFSTALRWGAEDFRSRMVVAPDTTSTVLSPKIDARFRQLYRTTQARLFRRNVLVAAAVYMAFVSWDVIVAPETIGSTVQTRLLLLGVCAFLFLASWFRSFERWYEWYYVTLITSAAMGVAAVLWVVPQGFAIGVTGVVLCIAGSSALFRATGAGTAAAGTLTTLGVIGLMILQGQPDYLIRGHAIFLVTAVGFAVLHSVQAERNAFEMFRAQERLETEKNRTQALLEDITTMRHERLAWLENLARFLRHELKNQIVVVGTSIDLAQTGDDERHVTEPNAFLFMDAVVGVYPRKDVSPEFHIRVNRWRAPGRVPLEMCFKGYFKANNNLSSNPDAWYRWDQAIFGGFLDLFGIGDCKTHPFSTFYCGIPYAGYDRDGTPFAAFAVLDAHVKNGAVPGHQNGL